MDSETGYFSHQAYYQKKDKALVYEHVYVHEWRIFQINFYLPSIVPENWGLLDSR